MIFYYSDNLLTKHILFAQNDGLTIIIVQCQRMHYFHLVLRMFKPCIAGKCWISCSPSQCSYVEMSHREGPVIQCLSDWVATKWGINNYACSQPDTLLPAFYVPLNNKCLLETSINKTNLTVYESFMKINDWDDGIQWKRR